MNRVEFEEHHSRTWDYVARVGKVWEAIAEEQQAIIDGKGYRFLGYSSHQAYWNGEFAEKTGWGFTTIEAWLQARRIKAETPPRFESGYEPTGPTQWRQIRSIESEDRPEFLARYEEEFKPRVQGMANQFREAVKEYKGEPVGVVDRLQEQGVEIADYPSGPTPEERAYTAASQLLSVAMDVTPEAAADSVSPGLAETVAKRYEALVPWTRRFVAQLHLRAGGR